MLQPPVKASEVMRSLASFYERGDLKVLEMVNQATFGYINALKQGKSDVLETTNQR